MGIFLPRSAVRSLRCDICDEYFYEDEQVKWARHVAKCARKHTEELRALAEVRRRRNPLEGAIDQEALEFQKKRYGPA